MSTSRKKRKILFIFLGLAVIVFLNFYSSGVRNFFYSISSDFQSFFWKKGINSSNFLKAVLNSGGSQKKIDDLLLGNQNLISEVSFLRDLEDENAILREALDLGLRKEFKINFAKVIGKDINQDYLVINKGKIDGIEDGMAAITQSKVMLGKIKGVSENFSKVMLLTNPESAIGGKILDSEIQGIIKGKGNSALTIDLIPKDKELKEGQTVITTPLAGDIPSGLLVGQVKKVAKSDISPIQEGLLVPFFDLNKLENIFIVTSF